MKTKTIIIVVSIVGALVLSAVFIPSFVSNKEVGVADTVITMPVDSIVKVDSIVVTDTVK